MSTSPNLDHSYSEVLRSQRGESSPQGMERRQGSYWYVFVLGWLNSLYLLWLSSPAHSILDLCGGKRSLEGENSSSICYATFLVYFLTIVGGVCWRFFCLLCRRRLRYSLLQNMKSVTAVQMHVKLSERIIQCSTLYVHGTHTTNYSDCVRVRLRFRGKGPMVVINNA